MAAGCQGSEVGAAVLGILCDAVGSACRSSVTLCDEAQPMMTCCLCILAFAVDFVPFKLRKSVTKLMIIFNKQDKRQSLR